MRNFLTTIKHSVYSPQFYATIPAKPLRAALGYFFLLSLVFTLITAILPVTAMIIAGPKTIETFIHEVAGYYPAPLELRISNGHVSTNVDEPYFVSFPIEKDSTTSKPKNLVVIDTTKPFSAQQFHEYNTFAWITADSIFVQNKNRGSEITTIDLSKTDHFIINKHIVDTTIARYMPWVPFIIPLGIGGLLLGIFLFHTLRLLYLFFFAFLLWLLSKGVKKSITYMDAYKISIYAITASLLAEAIQGLTPLRGVPFLFTLISLVVVWVNFLSKNTTVTPHKKRIKLAPVHKD